MSTELKKRILTAIFLFLFTIGSIFINIKIFIFILLIFTTLSFLEMNKLISKIFKFNTIFFFNIISFVYFFGIFYISCISLYLTEGPIIFFYLLLISIFSDIGGYVVGKNIGGKKLTKISPNKTISGSLGSLSFSIIPLFVYSYIFNYLNFTLTNFLLCIFISIFTQLGDLIISYMKRKAKVKDTGKILPGHGGFLDRVDGIIIALPFASIFLFSSYLSVILNFIN